MYVVGVVFLVTIMAALLIGCSEDETTGCEGTYNVVAMQTMGVIMTGEEAEGLTVILEADGKGIMEVNGDGENISWVLEGENITITVPGEEAVEFKGTLKDNCIELKDFMGMGMDCYLALEGSDAENPALYLSENEKEVLGTWKSSEVRDILRDDMSESHDPKGLTITLNADHTVEFVLDGKEYSSDKWERVLSMGTIEEKFTGKDGVEFEISFNLNDDKLEVSYSDTEGFLYYYCTR